MTLFTEEPTTALMLGGFALFILLIALWRTGRGVLLYVMLGVIILTGGLVLLERLVVTEYERVESTIELAATAIEANDVEGVLAQLASDATTLRNHVARRMFSVKIERAKFVDLNVTFNRLTNPPTATADFLANLKGTQSGVQFTFPSRLTVVLIEEEGRWVVTSYKFDRAIGN